MNGNPTDGSRATPSSGSVRFGPFLALVFFGNALGVAIFVVLAAAILSLPARSLWVPYVVLLMSGVVLAPYLYWARLVRDRPKACAFRFTIGVFSYLNVLTAGLLFGAVWVGVLSPTTALYDIFAFMPPLYALLSLLIYLSTVQLLKDTQRP